METHITAVPSGLGLESGPPMVVVPAPPGADTAELYRRFVESPRSCRAREPVAAIVRTELLNTPDRVRVTATRHQGNDFGVDLEIRRFQGPLAANDPWFALVRVDLGSPGPGAYEVVVCQTVLCFSDLHHPERAAHPITSEQRIGFRCD